MKANIRVAGIAIFGADVKVFKDLVEVYANPASPADLDNVINGAVIGELLRDRVALGYFRGYVQFPWEQVESLTLA